MTNLKKFALSSPLCYNLNMVFVFDLDDTVCDTDGYSEKFMLKFFEEHNLDIKQIKKTVRYAEQKFDWTTQQANEWYKANGDKMMSEFPLKSGAKEFFDKLKSNGGKIVISTARSDDWHNNPKGVTLEWLKNNGIEADRVFIGDRDKERICREVNADYFIDDDIEITKNVAQVFRTMGSGRQSFLCTTDFNKDLPVPEGVRRVNDFYELFCIIFGDGGVQS